MSIKVKVYNECVKIVDEKITILDKAIEDAQASANAEEKSTAGDKHDTARAMSHIERDMYAKQLSEALRQKKLLDAIDPVASLDQVEAGALVQTDRGIYFLSAAIGKISLEDKTEVFAISPLSPIAQKLIGKKTGSVVLFNGQNISVEKVF